MTPLDLTDNDLVTDTLAALHPHEHGGQAGLDQHGGRGGHHAQQVKIPEDSLSEAGTVRTLVPK